MGWASGSELAANVWLLVRPHIEPKQRKRVARLIIDMFESEDCDTIDEAGQLCADAGREYDEDKDEIVYR